MIRIPYEVIISKIKESSKLSEEQINSKIKAKMDQLAGLISKEGAAYIVANELNVKLQESQDGKLKIKDIYAGMRTVETQGKITAVYELREFTKQDGVKGKVASFIIGDETATIRVVLWNDQTDKLKELGPGLVVHIKDGYTKESNNGGVELHLASRAQLTATGEKGPDVIAAAPKQKAERKTIEKLTPADTNVEILATVVRAFEPRFYEVCPECNKRAKPKDNKFVCPTHGDVTPAYSCVFNLILDDGTGTIRTVFFKNQAANLLKVSGDELLKYKDSPMEFDNVKDQLLGNIIKVIGRTTKNELFDRLELVAQLVFPEPDADEELKRLEKEAEAIE